MKNLNIFIGVLIGLTIFSCSSDDNSNENQNQTAELVQVEQRRFFNDALEGSIITTYSNQRPTLSSYYDSSNQLTGTDEWNYNANNYLSSIKNYLSNGDLDYEQIFTYDSSNRMIQIFTRDISNSFNSTTNFTYNSDNTITSTTVESGSTKTFEINSNGVIDKEIVNGNVVVSVQYDNLKPISKTVNSTTYNYTYAESGSSQFSLYHNLFGNSVNIVLFQNSLDDSSDNLTQELITKIESVSSTEETTYTLNEDNFPLTGKNYYDGELDNEYTLTYE